MINFDKDEIKKQISIDQIFELLQEWGGDPEYTDFGILSATICHNPVGEGSHKLYFYDNNNLFYCYTNCGGFDIFELTMKVMSIQKNKFYDLNEAIRYIAYKFGILDEMEEDTTSLEDWKVFNRYNKAKETEIKKYEVDLKEYDDTILSRFNYNVNITPWLNEGIKQEVLDRFKIGFYPGRDQITIPHYNKEGKFIGLRGRTLDLEDAEKYGKYRPIKVLDTLYSHPLGMNLYNLNNSKDNIKKMGKAIVFEGEKSTMLYQSYFGKDADISVACCGSNLSAYQIKMLIDSGAKEIVVAFDRQFKEIGDNEFKHLTENLMKIHNRYKNYVKISFIFDKHMITGYKASPIDEGPEKFITLFKERINL